ncbi:hypothetical protein Tco_1333736 [Tanacetum coccineum]
MKLKLTGCKTNVLAEAYQRAKAAAAKGETNTPVNAGCQVINAWVFILLEVLFGSTVLDTLGMKETTYA